MSQVMLFFKLQDGLPVGLAGGFGAAGMGLRGLSGIRGLVTPCMGQPPPSSDLETLTSVGLVACRSRLYEADLCLNSLLVSTFPLP